MTGLQGLTLGSEKVKFVEGWVNDRQGIPHHGKYFDSGIIIHRSFEAAVNDFMFGIHMSHSCSSNDCYKTYEHKIYNKRLEEYNSLVGSLTESRKG